ncbi:MAG: outer membrane protein assembly factor BamE [Succinivibrionaceae bacterium]
MLEKLISTSFTTALLIFCLTAFNGCAYRPDLHQGNFVEQKAINQLRVGMTIEQVKFIMGTPMLTDPMDHSKWYYIHFKREGWSDPNFKTLVLVFDKNKKQLLDIMGDFEKPAEFNIPL